jgi:hypothetical protein
MNMPFGIALAFFIGTSLLLAVNRSDEVTASIRKKPLRFRPLIVGLWIVSGLALFLSFL